MNFKFLYVLFSLIVTIVVISFGMSIAGAAAGFVKGLNISEESLQEVMNHSDEEMPMPLVWTGTNIVLTGAGEQFKVDIENETKDGKLEIQPMTTLVVAKGKVDNRLVIILLNVVQSLLSFVVLGLGMAVIINTFKLFRAIDKALKMRDVFNVKMISRMRKLGWLLLTTGIVFNLFMISQELIGHIVLKPYNMDVAFFTNISYITFVLPLSILMVSEIFKLGHKIQEEQSLTV